MFKVILLKFDKIEADIHGTRMFVASLIAQNPKQCDELLDKLEKDYNEGRDAFKSIVEEMLGDGE